MRSYYFKFVLMLIASAALTLTSCKKSTSEADASISAQDLNNVSNAMHATSDDAASAAGQVSSYKGLGLGANWSTSGGALLVGATVTDTPNTGIVISYDGTTVCNGFTRSGTITVTKIGITPWHEAGAELNVTYNNLVVTDQISGYTYRLNGSHTITNVSGGLAWQVMDPNVTLPTNYTTTTTVTHQIQSSNMLITYPDGSQRAWTVNRTRTWSRPSTGVYIVSVSASPGVAGSVTETGTNRYGESFTNSITSPIIATNLSCELWRPYTGTFNHQIGSVNVNVQFGTNSQGADVGTSSYCGTLGNYGYYITYMNGSVTRNRFVSYWH